MSSPRGPYKTASTHYIGPVPLFYNYIAQFSGSSKGAPAKLGAHSPKRVPEAGTFSAKVTGWNQNFSKRRNLHKTLLRLQGSSPLIFQKGQRPAARQVLCWLFALPQRHNCGLLVAKFWVTLNPETPISPN